MSTDPAGARRPDPDPDTVPATGDEETAEARRTRQLRLLREMAELGMAVARKTAADVLDETHGEPAPGRDPALTFARATRIVRQAIALENRIVAEIPEPLPAPPPHDPRRPALRDALRRFSEAEPDRARRAQLRRTIEERIEQEILADPEHTLPVGEALVAICDDLGFPIDLSKVPDHLLDMRPGAWTDYRVPPPGANPVPVDAPAERPNMWLTPEILSPGPEPP